LGREKSFSIFKKKFFAKVFYIVKIFVTIISFARVRKVLKIYFLNCGMMIFIGVMSNQSQNASLLANNSGTKNYKNIFKK